MAASLGQEFCTLRDTYIEKQFGRLNDMQRQAVFTTDGPLLILAGAGSGKTTVLVNRIANLIRFGSAHGSKETPRPVTEEDVKALRTAIMTGTDAPSWLDGMLRHNAVRSWNVMAITFTNKAAGELKERLRRMLGGEEGDEWSTGRTRHRRSPPGHGGSPWALRKKCCWPTASVHCGTRSWRRSPPGH